MNGADRQSLVSQVENLTNKNERLDKEVLGLLSTVRALERENALLNERVANVDHAMVCFVEMNCG